MSDQEEREDLKSDRRDTLETSFEDETTLDQNNTLMAGELPTFNLADSPVSSIGFDSDDSDDDKTCLPTLSYACDVPSNNNNNDNNSNSNVSMSNASELDDSYISLEEINAQINSPFVPMRHKNSLETIYEGKFLETPPKYGNRKLAKDNKALEPKLLDLDDSNCEEDQVVDVKENVQIN